MTQDLAYESDREPDQDLRWELLRKLAARAGTKPPAIEIRARRTGAPIGFATGAAPELRQEMQILIDTDARAPLTFLIEELRDLWKHMKRNGTLPARSRTLEERKIALLEFVCLTHPDLSWNERVARWNKKQPRKWRYQHEGRDDRDAFTTACHDAEKQLTGSRSGLRWFYDPMARASPAELKAKASRGDVKAQEEIERRKVEGIRSIEDAGIKVTVQGSKREAKRGKKSTR